MSTRDCCLMLDSNSPLTGGQNTHTHTHNCFATFVLALSLPLSINPVPSHHQASSSIIKGATSNHLGMSKKQKPFSFARKLKLNALIKPKEIFDTVWSDGYESSPLHGQDPLWDLSNSTFSLCFLPKVSLVHIIIIYNQVLQPHLPHHLLLWWGNKSTQLGL